jgi:hypothetical protein
MEGVICIFMTCYPSDLLTLFNLLLMCGSVVCGGGAHGTVCTWRSEDSFTRCVLSYLYIGSRVGTQLTRLAQQGPCSLSHLINPEMIFLKMILLMCVCVHTHVCAVYICLYVCTCLCRCTCMNVWVHAETRGRHQLPFSTTFYLSWGSLIESELHHYD